MNRKLSLLALLLATAGVAAEAREKVLNLYSARHYQTDDKLYDNFSKQTGIKINRIEGKEEELMERIRNEGANSPADVFITVDAARLATADALGLFAPVKSKVLESRIPAHLRTDIWFSFSTRARVIIYNRSALSDEAQRYFADGNNEWPVVAGVATSNPALTAMGKFKADNLPIGVLAKNVVAAQKLLDRAGYR